MASRTRQEFIAAAGNLCRRLGLPRSIGQIYGLLFFSAHPLSLDQIADHLGISKGSASTGSRQLVNWGAIRQVWVPGDRRDYFELGSDVATLLRDAYRGAIKPRISNSQKRLEQMLAALNQELAAGIVSQEEFELCTERLVRLCRLQKKLQSTIPLIERLL